MCLSWLDCCEVLSCTLVVTTSMRGEHVFVVSDDSVDVGYGISAIKDADDWSLGIFGSL